MRVPVPPRSLPGVTLSFRYRRPNSESAVGSARCVDQHGYHGMSVCAERRFGIRGLVIALEAFLRCELIENAVLGPSGNRIQLASPDTGRCLAHRSATPARVSRVHLLFVFHRAIEAADLNVRGACHSFLIRRRSHGPRSGQLRSSGSCARRCAWQAFSGLAQGGPR